ncbi:uncharacterized protein [Coffea arabica]|uniref:peptidylprolyl isomerase n=1 Tax=Coffea arabica TaxID=13443 RepID=A0ABM4V044_COFAR
MLLLTTMQEEMTFWGAYVTLNEPYILNSDGKRLRITQATLEPQKDGSLTRARSILQCTVGSKPPVSICSLSKEFTFTQLDLELEESEQVIFAVKGPQIIHLSGYYVPSQAVSKREASTSTDDLIIDCNGEADKVMAENREERKLTAVERDIANTFSMLDCRRDDTPADEEMVNEKVQLHAPESILDGEDEDYVPCMRKSAATAKKMLKKGGEDADKVIVQASKLLKAVDCIKEETADGVSRPSQQEREESLMNNLHLASNEVGMEKCIEPEKISVEPFCKEDASHSNTLSCWIANFTCIFNTQLAKIGEARKQALDGDIGGSPPLPSMFVLPSCEPDLQKSLRKEKKRIDGCGNEKKTTGGDTEYQKNAIKENEVQQAHKESDDLYQGCAGSQHHWKSFTSIESSGSFHSPSKAGLPCQIDRLNNGKKKKKRKEGCDELKTIEAIVYHRRNALKENKVNQSHTESDNTCQGRAGNRHDQILAKNIGEMGESSPSLPRDEVHDAVDQKPKERLTNGNVQVWPKTNDDAKRRIDNRLTFFSGESKCPNGSIPLPAEDRSKNGQKSKKRKKHRALDQNYVNGDGDAFQKEIFSNIVADMGSMRNHGDLIHESCKCNTKNLLTEAKFKQNIQGTENMEIVLPTNIEHQMPMDDTKNHESYPDLVKDGYQSYKEFKKKKKLKIKAKQNGNDLCSTSKARAISNEIIIEDLAAGESGGKVAAPGRKIKVFYTVRSRETGSLLESNLGEEKPFKFRLGDKKVIQGWNLGINGMRIGDRRRLIIPPSMVYGERAPDVFPSDSWLVYDIELVSVR